MTRSHTIEMRRDSFEMLRLGRADGRAGGHRDAGKQPLQPEDRLTEVDGGV